MTEPAETTPPRWLLVSALASLALVIALGVRYADVLVPLFHEPERLRVWVDSFGPVAPLVLIALGALQVIVAPIPGQVIGVVAGYLFGAWLGALYATVGLVLGTIAAMALARALGRPFVLRFVDEARLSRWDALTKRWGPAVFFVAFLLPGLPDDLLCFVIGLTGLRLGPMVVYAAVGRLPGMIAAAYLGAHAEGVPGWAWGVGALVVGLLAIALFARGEALAEAIAKRLGH